MGEESLVVFKGTAEGIVVILDNEADFEAILNHFKEKLESSKTFFIGSGVSMKFRGRALTRQQQDMLLMVLANQNIVNLSSVLEFEETDKNEDDHHLLWIKEQLDCEYASLTHFHYGIVRSGHHVDYQGNVIVLGDVNPGGLVTAGGHVIVLGTLKGKVHAGTDTRCSKPFVVAYVMEPIQIGIRNIIAQSANHESVDSGNNTPQIAYLHEEQIYVDQIDFKTLNHMLK